jgi:hypothetical protein
MNTAPTDWEHPQLRDLRSEFLSAPAMCERALIALGEPPPQLQRVCIRTDSESIDVALARALALAVDGVSARVELT